jgi:hypothetical protein
LPAILLLVLHFAFTSFFSYLMNNLYASLTLLLAVGGATVACAQDRVLAAPSVAFNHARPFQVAYLRASIGLNPTIGWEYRCPRVAIEYAPMLTRHLGLAARLAGSAGKPSASTGLYGSWIKDIPNQNYRAGFFEAEGLIYPFGNTRRVRFALGAGGFAGYYKLNTISSANIVDNKVVTYELGTRQGVSAGYLASLNLEVALGKQRVWLVGLKATRQKGLGGITNLPGQSLTLARQL